MYTIPILIEICHVLSSDSGVVGIATRYGMDGPGFESRWGRDFPHPSRPASCTMGTGSVSRGKAGGAWS